MAANMSGGVGPLLGALEEGRVRRQDAPQDQEGRNELLYPQQPVPQDHERHSGGPLLTVIGFAFLTFNSGMAIYRSAGDPASISFVSFGYVDLVLLFFCLRRYERGDPSNPAREKLKAAVWLLTTVLTLAFSYKVVTVFPPLMAASVLAMTAAGLLGIFYGFCNGGQTLEDRP